MNLSRELLESEYFQKLATANARPDRPVPLTREQLEASLQQLLANRPDTDHVWIFGYGSLVWNPIFHFDSQVLVTLHGYRRRFCLKTEISRGTPECPGLVLGLEPGGSCRGVAYRIIGDHLESELRLLWKREMVTGAYAPRWVRLRRADQTEIQALAFVMNRYYASYVRGLSDEETARILASACGPLGSSAEYLFNTHRGLKGHGIIDRHLDFLCERVQQLQACAADDRQPEVEQNFPASSPGECR